jgi:hypothetical protein
MSASSANETQVYTIEMVAEITHLERERIILFHRDGLVHAIVTEPEPRFDDAAVLRLRHIAFLLTEYHLDDTGLRHFAALLDEVERLRAEVRFLRG